MNERDFIEDETDFPKRAYVGSRLSLRRDDFERVATAETVVATAGAYQFEFSRALRKDLRLMLERMPAQKGPRTAGSDSSGSGP